jgi:hypothetical protein
MRPAQIRRAWRLIEQLRAAGGEVDVSGAVGDAAIRQVEQALGVPLPASYRVFLREFGAIDVGMRTIGGIYWEDRPLVQIRGNVHWNTVQQREELGLREELLVLEIQEDEWYACLDTAYERGGECPVRGIDRPPMKGNRVITRSFGAYVLHFLTGVLEARTSCG